MGLYESKLYINDVQKISNCVPDIFKSKSILITGATGLIGSFLVDVMLAYNEKNSLNEAIKIFCLGRSEKKFKERFKKNYNNSSLFFLEQDITDPIKLDEKIDYIFHGASNADPKTYAKYPVATILTNIIGTENILNYAKKQDTCRVLLMSTMEVYGEMQNKGSYNEDEYGRIDFNQVRSGYPESKRAAELLARAYFTEFHIDIVIARLGYIYGPSMQIDDSKVVAQFIKNAINNEDIILKSKGEQIRSYCYVADSVSALLKLMEKGKAASAYNISDNESVVSVKQLAEITSNLANKKVIFQNPDFLESKGFSKPLHNVLDNEKLINLGWKPVTNIFQGIEKTIKILKENA